MIWIIPASVPKSKQKEYVKNYKAATQNSGRLMLFAGDQKVEHLNGDFFGKGIDREDANPEHLFRIASKAKIGVFAVQLGLIDRYGKDYPKVNYLVKVNSKTNLIKTKQRDPVSRALVTIDEIMEFKKNSGLNIVGVGYTIYLGSEFEDEMFTEASQLVYNAHKNGLIAILWMYPRGKAVAKEKDAKIIAGATGVAACLGADFVKVNYPENGDLREAIAAAGRTKVICAGGGSVSEIEFLKKVKMQLNEGAGGNATGRNIHQKSLKDAVKLCNAIYALTVESKSLDYALSLIS